jgi:hypothetical protein
VTAFDGFHRPASPDGLSRRRAANLDAAEEANLLRWGYFHVLDRFRFHVTLTGPLDPVLLDRLQQPLAALFAPATAAPTPVADIALFLEPAPGEPFRLVRRFSLAGRRKVLP